MSDTVHNAYPELPVVPYVPTQVPMQDMVAYLQDQPGLVGLRRTAYTIFRIESANGHAGINNNYCGVQADGGRWPEEWTPHFVGTVLKAENATQRMRRFVAMDAWHTSVDLLASELMSRGIYPGGDEAITDTQSLCNEYYRKWVTGETNVVAPHALMVTFLSIFDQAMVLFV